LPLLPQGDPQSIQHIALSETVRHMTCSTDKQHVMIDESSVSHHILDTASKVSSSISIPLLNARQSLEALEAVSRPLKLHFAEHFWQKWSK
jgi:hypothetical protein